MQDVKRFSDFDSNNADHVMQVIESEMLMFDKRPTFKNVDLGVRCYNKSNNKCGFHYGNGKNHREAVANWIETANWK